MSAMNRHAMRHRRVSFRHSHHFRSSRPCLTVAGKIPPCIPSRRQLDLNSVASFPMSRQYVKSPANASSPPRRRRARQRADLLSALGGRPAAMNALAPDHSPSYQTLTQSRSQAGAPPGTAPPVYCNSDCLRWSAVGPPKAAEDCRTRAPEKARG